MIFNSTTYSNLTNITQILTVADTFAGGMLGIGILIMISFGTLMVLSRYDIKQGMIAASFVGIIMSLFLSFLGLLDGQFVMGSLALFVVVIVISFLIKGDSGGI